MLILGGCAKPYLTLTLALATARFTCNPDLKPLLSLCEPHSIPVERIIEVDDAATPTLETFINVIREKKTSVRVKSVGLDGRERMTSIPLDSEFFGLYKVEYSKDTLTWRRSEL